METKNTGVLVIDMQPSFLNNPKTRPFAMTGQVIAIKKLINFAQETGMPIFYLEYNGQGKTVPELMPEGIPSSRIITKPSVDGFCYTRLESNLKSEGIAGLAVAGIYASACVEMTVKSGLERQFKIATSRDLIGDSNMSDYNYALPYFMNRTNFFNNHEELLKSFIVSQKFPAQAFSQDVFYGK